MALEAWLPIGHCLPDGTLTRRLLHEGPGWQIIEIQGGRALIATDPLMQRWRSSGLVQSGAAFEFAGMAYWSLTSPKDRVLAPVAECKSPDSKSQALSFALSMKATREIDASTPLQDALYVEKLSRLLPTYSITTPTADSVILGYWLTGGAGVSASQVRRLCQMMSWLSAADLKTVVKAAGVPVDAVVPDDRTCAISGSDAATGSGQAARSFSLPGRPELEKFFNEHVVDIVQNRDRYKALGIDFPGAIALHGPPGCGKTFAVEALVEFLGWPSFQIDASSVASPYIHETSKKVADVFDKAMANSPSVLVIDEMESFLADREMGSGHHRVEEVGEFLRRIPEATRNDVLVVAMTNRIDMIDPAILRRGRFDHVIGVDLASEAEVKALLEKLVAALPKEDDVEIGTLAAKLAQRPLSDVAFVVREGARLAARSGHDRLNQRCLLAALDAAPARDQNETGHRIGFI